MASVGLLSFATKEDKLYLGEQLGKLGYQDQISIESDSTNFGVLSENGILVLQLRNISTIKSKVIRSLKSLGRIPALGLFNERENHWDHEIIKLCHDVAVWPCSESELSYRLNRISQYSSELLKDNEYLVRLNMVGESEEFKKVLSNVSRIARCDAPVYIDGETGTGKELIARSIHYSSERSSSPFVAINCGAIPDNLMENELFGHVRGAFTDAKATQKGMIAHAEGGTLFLDEVETLTAKGQITILRFLQDYEYRPIGASNTVTANIRLITASNEPLANMVEQGQFRKDLFYRISIMNLQLPPLRERIGDVELLTEHFLAYYMKKYNGAAKYIHGDTLEGMKRYSWPGNIRELENILHREFVLSDSPEIRILMFEQLPTERRGQKHDDRRHKSLFNFSMKEAKSKLVKDFECKYLANILHRANGNITEAARMAGKERRTFAKLLEKYSIKHSN